MKAYILAHQNSRGSKESPVMMGEGSSYGRHQLTCPLNEAFDVVVIGAWRSGIDVCCRSRKSAAAA